MAVGQSRAEARDTLIRDMKAHDMYVGNLENQGLVRLIQHLGSTPCNAEILTHHGERHAASLARAH